MSKASRRIIVSRTDSIGDVMLTLPICSWIKSFYPNATIVFLGKGYTRPVVEAYQDVDLFEDWADYESLGSSERVQKLRDLKPDTIIHVFPRKEIARLAAKAKIDIRIGTSHRLFHMRTCNYKLDFTRKRSPLHEAQLNFELLRPLGMKDIPTLEEINAYAEKFHAPDVSLPEDIRNALSTAKGSVILHPKSQGSAREWPMKRYLELTSELIGQGKTVIYTGTESEGSLFRSQLPVNDRVLDTTGKLSLNQLIQLISQVDALVACSTGPLHIAGYLGVRTVGLFSSRKPIHPGRWKALGNNVTIIVDDPQCGVCASGKDCPCIEQIRVDTVLNALTDTN